MCVEITYIGIGNNNKYTPMIHPQLNLELTMRISSCYISQNDMIDDVLQSKGRSPPIRIRYNWLLDSREALSVFY